MNGLMLELEIVCFCLGVVTGVLVFLILWFYYHTRTNTHFFSLTIKPAASNTHSTTFNTTTISNTCSRDIPSSTVFTPPLVMERLLRSTFKRFWKVLLEVCYRIKGMEVNAWKGSMSSALSA